MGLFTPKNATTEGKPPMPEGISTIIHLCPRSTSYRARGNNVDYGANPRGAKVVYRVIAFVL